jgi:hypothetical protein
MKINFLVPSEQPIIPWLKVQLTTMQTDVWSLTPISKSTRRTSLELQEQSVRERVAYVTASLRGLGVTVGVQLYVGSVKKAIVSWCGTDAKVIVPMLKRNAFREMMSRLPISLARFRLGFSDPGVLLLRQDFERRGTKINCIADVKA